MALASAQMKAGQLDSALANYGQAQVLCTKNDYQLGLAQLHADLGLLLQGLGRFPEAEQMLLKSFSIAEKQGEIAIAAVAAANLALLYRETQDLDRAEQTIRQALALETRLKHKDGVARGNLNLGTILFEKGRFAEAASHFQKSLDLYTELDLQGLAAQAVCNLGNAQRALKDDGGAERCYRKALDLFLAAGDASGVARAAGNLGAVYLDVERFADAEQEFMLALDAAREAGEPRAVAMQMRNLGVLAHLSGQPDEACAKLKESLAICLEANAETEAVEVKVLMGQYRLRSSAGRRSERGTAKSLTLGRTVRREDQARCWISLGCAGARLGLGGHLVMARGLGQHVVDLGHRACLVELLDGGDLAGHAVERGFVELALGIRLLGLRLGAVEVAHHLGDGDEIAGVDLRLVFLGAPGPHGALDARLALERAERLLDGLLLGQLAHADGRKLRGRHPERHLVLLEVDDEELERSAGNFLLFNAHDPANAMSRIDDILVGAKTVSLLGLFLFSHTLVSLFEILWRAPMPGYPSLPISCASRYSTGSVANATLRGHKMSRPIRSLIAPPSLS